jgi:hypothetical protein
MKYNNPEYESNIPDRHTRGLDWQKKKIIVLAGNREQFERYLADNGLTDSEAVYGFEPDRIYGIRASKVEIIGTFWERKDASKLKEVADSRII